MSKIDELHEKNAYFVSQYPVDKGMIIYFPANLLVSPPISAETHKYIEGDGKIIYDDTYVFNCPNYARKLVRLTDVLMKMLRRQMDTSLLKEVVESTEPEKMGEVDFQKFKILSEKIIDILYSEYNIIDAKKDGVEEGFRAIFKIFVMGGF